MQPSVFEMFKIGVGPSSSHTMGPMTAAARFLDLLRGGDRRAPGAGPPERLGAKLHGSLAFTGKGHATDRAVLLGLMGFRPETLDPDAAEAALAEMARTGLAHPPGLPPLRLSPDAVAFDFGEPLPLHPNGLTLEARDAEGRLHLAETYYSPGGGFVQTAAELAGKTPPTPAPPLPHPFATAAELLARAGETGLSLPALLRANEAARAPGADLNAGLDAIWTAMRACMDRGLSAEGELPGGLRVRRRAAALRAQLEAERGRNQPMPHAVNDWLNLYAMAVNEENAAGGRVVTAPTNGAAGVFPAVVRYWLDHVPGARADGVRDMLLVGGALGGIVKTNASISGAEVGCQGEVGAAAAMAAGALACVLGGTPAQVENAAEIALEHHLGMTCDPVAGLVQVPCIERNGMGAVKAVAAASLALRGDGAHVVSLDACIETLRATGRDMDRRYKETSQGGLAVAVNLPEC